MPPKGTKHTKKSLRKIHIAFLGRKPNSNSFKKGVEHPNWKGGSTINGQGYRTILNPKRDEPKERQYVLEHRYVMEQHLNRKLLEYEHVHHINGIKTDNRLENLVVKTSTDHYGSVTCPHCLTHFRIR